MLRNLIYKFSLLLISILIGFAIISIQNPSINKQSNSKLYKVRSTSSPKASIESKKGRMEYFYRMLQDPKTKEIPKNIRQKELAFAKNLQKNTASLRKTSVTNSFDWQEAGPTDVGGRTRALAVDVNNPNIIIAGGVSGGIWKSTDKGTTWDMKSTTNQVLSVTSIAQDTRSGHTDTWYYATGEFQGGSARDRGGTHLFSGDGIYKSVDNCETWNLLQSTANQNPTFWDSEFDYVSRILVNHITGNVYVASHAFGVMMSNNGGTSFSQIYGAVNDHQYVDIAIMDNGDLIVAASSGWNPTPTNNPGVYLSSNEGQTWSNITPQTLPADHQRSVLAAAPSNDNIVYLLTNTGEIIDEKYEDIRFHKINVTNATSEDRSANMPNFGYDFQDYIITQFNYNLTLAVKPDDENFIVIGATSLFRSTDGFATAPVSAKLDWIGGYHPTIFRYPNLHPDIHSFAFDPTNPNAMWCGHDGGLSYTSDISNSNYATYFPWENKNNSYNVTQFYMVAIPDGSGDDRIMGGTQDNGTPAFRFDGAATSESYDVSSGDGSYAYFGDNHPYVSTQYGLVIRAEYNSFDDPVREFANWSNISPKDAAGMLFINPYSVDPNDENYMYYPAGNFLWRNNQLRTLPNNPDFQEGITNGWTKLNGLSAPAGYSISALEISRNNPDHRLYYGASNNSQSPKLYRLDNAKSEVSGALDISVPNVEPSAYLHNIAINPDDADEILVIFSNYNLMGIYHSTDGGQSYSKVEGNLEGDMFSPGPSVRGASILPTVEGTLYLVATSTGVYSTSLMNDTQTIWIPEGSGTVGNVVCNYIASRKSDGRIVIGTHGRGAFMSTANTVGTANATTDVQLLNLEVDKGETNSVSFQLSNTGSAEMTYNITASGQLPVLAARNSGIIKTLNSPGPSMKESILAKRDKNRTKELKVQGRDVINKSSPGGERITLSDVLYLDDGDENADGFVGYGNSEDFYWLNEFNLTGTNFQLDGIDFYMSTESAASNKIYMAVYNDQMTTLAEGNLTLSLAENGGWFNVTLSAPIDFPPYTSFSLLIGTVSSNILYPAGADIDATVTGKSYILYGNSNLIPLSSVAGYGNGAFLIRAVGTISGIGQDPVAIANVNPSEATVNQEILFDASGSYDSDGQITSYLWKFGDGSTSTEIVVNHSYTLAGNYTYSLLVTDNEEWTDQTGGQVTILDGILRLSVNPSSGTIAEGGSRVIQITLDAAGLLGGNYNGEVNIVTNGGNIILPLNIVVHSVVSLDELKDVPTEFHLSQNYPNPFNPETTIEFSIPEKAEVNLKIYDIKGEEIKTLIQGNMNPGRYSVNFDASGLVSGIYIYRIRANTFIETKKLILLK